MTDVVPFAPHREAIRARIDLRLGPVLHYRARASLTPVGALSLGAMVGAILLSTAAIVHAARTP
jgi:hypothetical protein